MKFDKYLLTAGALLLVWSLRSEAHSSFEAMQQSGNLSSLTAAALHPLLENPFLIVVAVTLVLAVYALGWFLNVWTVCRKILAGRPRPTVK